MRAQIFDPLFSRAAHYTQMTAAIPFSDDHAKPGAEALFYGTFELSAGERREFLERACAGNAELREEVEGMLRDHEAATGFMTAGAPFVSSHGTTFPALSREKSGDWMGPYKLLEQLGEGGFGTVWVAEQEKPVRRRVALKIIKLGMDTKEVIARFEQERQALAMMDHPNIARVLDAGATPIGRPYFVMELVRGVKITKYCDQNNLPTADRLKLFIAVCHAVQHAHQKGIIHRDLKPSNILVTLHDGVPVPKVIDFGVAKATQQQRLTDLTIYTQFEQMVGTPLYMSPEQAEMSGLDIDTRSDIYSLGVLLYELLAGRTPFDPETLMKRGLDEIRRAVREEVPQKPSTFVSTMALQRRSDLAQHRQTDSAKLLSQIRGDLDWIVMKALEKDRSRRYDTANGLALDIQRHLVSEPVLARPPSAGYRFRQYARRHKAALTAAAAVLTALFAGLVATTWMFFKEKDARERAAAAEHEQSRLRQLAEAAVQSQSEERTKAEAEAEKSKQVAQFLKDMLKGVAPSVALGDDTKMLRKILDQTAERIGADLQNQREAEAELRTTIGKVYDALGDYVKAAAMLDEALRITKKLRGEEHKDVVFLLIARAQVLAEQGELDEAEAMLRHALEIDKKLAGPDGDVSTSLSNLGLVLENLGKLGEAETLHREALAMERKLKADGNKDVAISLNNLAVVLQKQAKYGDSETALREALAIQRKLFGDVHPEMATTLNNLANAVAYQNRLPEAEALFRELVPIQRKLLGNAHPNVAAGLNGLGLALLNQGRAADAEPFLTEAVEIERKARPGAHPQKAMITGNLGRVMEGLSKFDEAESLVREALDILSKLPGSEHPYMGNWRNQLINLLATREKWPELEAVIRDDLASARKAASGDAPHPAIAEALIYLATALRKQQKFPEAETLLLEAHEALQQMQKAPRELLREYHLSLVRLYENWDKPDKASEWRQKFAAFDTPDTVPDGELKAASSKQ